MANSSHAIPPKDWLNSIFLAVVGPTCWSARTRSSASLPIKSLPKSSAGIGRRAAGLKSSLAGRKPKNLPPLDLSGGTEFQKRVWNALRKISTGRTKSYGEIAQAIGKPKAVRAVGGACGANPVPVFVPCHRVLAANKKLGGFSGGLDWKRSLLAREGVNF